MFLDAILTPSSISAIAIAALSSGVLYLIRRLNEQRRFYTENDLPQPPHDWLWGHAKLMGEYASKITGDYLQASWTQMKFDHKLPEVYYVDMWPFGPEFIMCTDADSMAFSTTTQVYEQADVVTDFFRRDVGETFIEASNGPVWKELHQMLAPGLTPGAIKTYHDHILDETKKLHERVRVHAQSGEVVDLADEIGKYPFAVIWNVMFGGTPPAKLYGLTRRFADISQAASPLMNPIVKWLQGRERKATVKILEAEIDRITRVRFAEMKAMDVLPTRTTATCLLDRMLLGYVQEDKELDDRLMKLIYEKYIHPPFLFLPCPFSQHKH